VERPKTTLTPARTIVLRAFEALVYFPD